MGRLILQSTAPTDTSGPTAPTITATAASSSTVTINRTAVATDASGILNYETQRSPADAGTWTTFDTSNTNPLTASGLSAATAYDFRQRAIDTLSNVGSFSETASATTEPSGMTFELQSLITGINGGAIFDDNSGGAITSEFTSDGIGNYARLSYPSGGGTGGYTWNVTDSTKRQIYIKWDCRRSSTRHTKLMKIFGKGYPSTYSNGNYHVDYVGTGLGWSYADDTGGGDIGVQFFIGSYPTLTGGSAFSRSPHPIEKVDIATNAHVNSIWDTHEVFWKQNDDGTPNGELAIWFNSALVGWYTAMYNCRTGGQGFNSVALGNYSNGSGVVIEDYRNWYISYDRPTGRGI